MTSRERADDVLHVSAHYDIRAMFAAALAAVEPSLAVERTLRRDGDTLQVGDAILSIAGGVHIVAVGKAAVAMTRGAIRALGDAVISGDVLTKEGHVDSELPSHIRVSEAGHPIPDERGVRATTVALEALRVLSEDVVVLALISGGGSALLEAPVDGVTLSDLASMTDQLLRAGAPIQALNATRAPLSQVKAGGLRRAAPDADWVTLILSDVLSNDPRVIASGPTLPNRADPERALAALEEFGVAADVPASIVAALQRSAMEPDRRMSDRDIVRIVGDNASAVAAAAKYASDRDCTTAIVWRKAEGEAAELGRAWVDLAADASPEMDVLLGGGEATVTVRGAGLGGRNTEFALAAALELERRAMRDWVVASLATDGQDALTGAAGAIADAETCCRARERGIQPEDSLRDNDSLGVFLAAGGAVITGPTGTNVNDIFIAYRASDSPSSQE
jgi:hydroxypyruvate reductase